MAETILSYLLAELQSSNPQRISKKNWRSGIRRRRHLSYTLWVGDGEWEDMAEILSYLLAEESSNRQRISKKMGGLGSGEDGISPIPCGPGMENGKTWPRPSYRICWRRRVAIRKGFRKKWAVWDEKTASLLYPVGRGWRMGRNRSAAAWFLNFNCRKHCAQSLSDLLGVLQGTRTSRDPLRGRDPLRHLDIGQSPTPCYGRGRFATTRRGSAATP
jgi:hypothetical protein